MSKDVESFETLEISKAEKAKLRDYVEARIEKEVNGITKEFDKRLDLLFKEFSQQQERIEQTNHLLLETLRSVRETKPVMKDFYERMTDLIKERTKMLSREIVGSQGVNAKLSHLEDNTLAIIRKLFVDDADLSVHHQILNQRFRVFSQNMEDGVVYSIFKLIGTTNKTFIEICSGDNGGNSGFLASDLGWSGLMVDGNDAVLQFARERFERFGVKVRKHWVTRENVNSIILDAGFSGEIDFLSIDVDGVDYWLWQAINAVNPRLVAIEYNPQFGPDRSVTVPYQEDFSRHMNDEAGPLAKYYYGASLVALNKLALKSGYKLLTVEPSGVNAFFVRNDILPEVPGADPTEIFRRHPSHWERQSKIGDLYEFINEKNLKLVEI